MWRKLVQEARGGGAPAPQERTVPLTVTSACKVTGLHFLFSTMSGSVAAIPCYVSFDETLELLHTELDVPADVAFKFVSQKGDMLTTPSKDFTCKGNQLHAVFEAIAADTTCMLAGEPTKFSAKFTTRYREFCNTCSRLNRYALKHELPQEFCRESLTKLQKNLR